MGRILLTAMALFVTVCASAQVNSISRSNPVLDADEDTTQTTTINDIIAMQQKVLISSDTEKHFDKVWGRRKYRNFSYNSSKLKSKEAVALGTGKSKDLDFKSDWGFGIEMGTNYRLHKPISNLVSISLDYTWFDLNLNHFKAEDNATYDSSDEFKKDGESYFYMPWDALEKYEVNYGMMVGPSLTVAPFTSLASNNLHFFKIQLYYHLGYRFSTIFFKNDKSKDTSNNTELEDELKSTFKGEYGTGFYTKFGFNISWKTIGLGYEHSSGSLNYKPYNKDTFGKEKNKFTLGSSRIFLQLRF